MNFVDTKNWKRIFGLFFVLVFSIFFIPNIFGVMFQMEWNNITITPESWIKINLENTYANPIVVATPEYTTTTNDNGISTWITNVTVNSFMLRVSDENFNASDNVRVHYMAMEEGAWYLPGSNIKVEAGKVFTNKVAKSGAGNHQCPTYGEVVNFTNTFNSNPLVISTRGSNNNPNSWAASFQNDPADQTNPVPTDQICVGLSQSKAISPGSISNNETVYWIAADEGNGTIGNHEFEILWNLQDTGDSGGNWINGYKDSIPFTQSWAHSWTGSPNLILASQTSTAGSDGSWPVIYDTGNTASIRMFVDEPNERSHSGSESGGGWAFDGPGKYGNFPPSNIFVNFSKSLVFLNQNNTINAVVIDSNGNNTISDVVATVVSPNSTKYNVTLDPEILNKSLSTGDIENSSINYTAINDGEVIGEAGSISLANRTSVLIKFKEIYNQTPVIIAVVSTQNNDDSPFIPVIHSINTTHVNISLCRDNGASTCDNNYLNETVNYAIFDVNKSNKYSWLEVGRVNATTDGSQTAFSFGKTFANAPSIWALPQTYNIDSVVSNGIAGQSWFVSTSTTGSNLVGCDHPGTANSCAGTATEEFGYVAIDTSNANFTKFSSGSKSISNSAWTAITYSESYLNPRVFVMVNSENGAQDPKYPWAKNVGSSGADIRYCEADAANYCDSHNGETTEWFVLEDGKIGIGNGGADVEKNLTIKTYQDIFTNITHNISSMQILLNITKYNNSASLKRGNKNPDLVLELKNGINSWKSFGNLNITSTGIYKLNITDNLVFNAWTNKNNRDLKIRGVNFDYYSASEIDMIEYNLTIMNLNYSIYSSNWTGLFSNIGICGIYNLTDLYSTDIENLSNHTTYLGINFTVPCNPIVTLISPLNGTKFFGFGDVNLTWSVLSGDSNLSCGIYINSILNKTVSCNSSINNSIILNLGSGRFNWTVNATDSLNLSDTANPENFINILERNASIIKRIYSVNKDIYGINISVENLVNIKSPLTIIDYVSNLFNPGSFVPNYNWTNTTSGLSFNGNIYGFDLLLNSSSNEGVSYLITKNSFDYYLLDEFVVSLD